MPYAGAGGFVPRALTRGEIAEIVERFGDAARRAAEARCDFIGIHSAHGYLLAQFLSPWCNKRDDEYGGDLAGRMRFPLEVLAAVRKATGGALPIVYRISGDEHQDNGLTLADVCAIAPHLVAAGVDLIDVSAGMYETNWWITQPMEMPQGVLAPLAREVRRHVDVPVSVSGRITDPSVAEHLIESGACDFVTLGRALHADPEFPGKARDGRTGEICTCIACNQGCSDMHSRGLPIVCLVNTTTGREREYAIRPTAAPKRIVVVGGGPAGLEAARILALRGHAVTLFERDEEPGGQMLLSRLVPGREELSGHLPWLVGAVARAGVTLELGVEADADRVLAEQPDIVDRRDRFDARPAEHPRHPRQPGRRRLPDPAPAARRHRPRAGDRRRHPRPRRRARARGKGVEVILVEPVRRARHRHRHALAPLPDRRARRRGRTSRSTSARRSRRWASDSAQLWNGTERWEEATSTSSFRPGCCCPSTGSPTRCTSGRRRSTCTSSATARSRARRWRRSTTPRRWRTGSRSGEAKRATVPRPSAVDLRKALPRSSRRLAGRAGGLPHALGHRAAFATRSSTAASGSAKRFPS